MIVGIHDVATKWSRTLITCGVTDLGLVFDREYTSLPDPTDWRSTWSILVSREQFPMLASRLLKNADSAAVGTGGLDQQLLDAVVARYREAGGEADAQPFSVIHYMLVDLGVRWRRTSYTSESTTPRAKDPPPIIETSDDVPKAGDVIWIEPDWVPYPDHDGGQSSIKSVTLGGPLDSLIFVVPVDDSAAEIRYDYLMSVQNRLKQTHNHPFKSKFRDSGRASEEAVSREAEAPAAKAAEEQRRSMPGAEFRDAEGLPLMVTIPPGSFTMGSPTTETGRYNREGPQQEVRIAHTLAVGKYPVTVGEWRKFVGETHRYSATRPYFRCWYSPGFRQDESHPVTCVSWHDASDYANWVSNQTGKSYRLLTEAEWEYACRAGTTTLYAFGDDITPQQANFDGTKRGTTSVGAYSPNPFGLSDMHGNVWEWCDDCYRDTLEGQARNGEAFKEPPCSFRVIRGGYWGNGYPQDLRSASRLKCLHTNRNFDIGFRVARSLSSTP